MMNIRKNVIEKSGYVNGSLFLDFGRASYGQLELEMDGVAYDLAQVVLSEYAENGVVKYAPGWKTFIIDNFRITPQQKVYKVNIPQHRACYGQFPHIETPKEFGGEIAIFRYVQVNHYWGPVKVRKTEFFNCVPEDAAHFESSNKKLDKIWDFCHYSMLATSVFPCYLDGERERRPYEGDAYITELGHFCCGADYSIARRTIDFFFAYGDKTWPTEWILATPLLIQNYVLYSGDTRPLKRWLPQLPAKLLPQMCRKDGLLAPTGHVRDIVDWPETERDGYEFGKANFVPNAYYYGALLAVAELTGDKKYLQQAAKLKATMRKKMLKNGFFVDNPDSKHTSMHTAMFALRFGLTEGDETARHQALVKSRGMACSVYGAQFLLESCFAGGMDKHGVELMTNDGKRSWFNMLREGSTVSMEAWGDSFKPGQDWSHPWGAAPANIIPRLVAGVRPTAPGFASFVVKPSPAAPKSFFLRQPTPFGAIEVRKDGSKLDVKLVGTHKKLVKAGPGEYSVK